MPLYDLILSKNNDKLVFAAIQFYTDSSQPDKALSLLKYLKSKNYQSEQTKDLQEKLAARLAENDKKLNQKSKVKSQIFLYTGNSKWFKYFNKRYKEEMKK